MYTNSCTVTKTLTGACTVCCIKNEYKHFKHCEHNCPLWEIDSYSGWVGVLAARVVKMISYTHTHRAKLMSI